MTGTPDAPAGVRTALWGLGVAVLGLGLALVATIDMLKRERRTGERAQATVQTLLDSPRTDDGTSGDPRSLAADPLAGVQGRIEGITRDEIAALRDQGLVDLVPDLKADLARHLELIPVTGTLGGRMGFYTPDRIWILNGRWAFADFEDCHIGGSMLLEYRVEGGRARWTRLAAIGP